MNYFIIGSSIGVILFASAYLSFQQGAAIYNPSNPASIILFLVTLLISGIWAAIDWSTTRYHVLVSSFKSRINTILEKIMHWEKQKFEEDKYYEVSGRVLKGK